MKNLFCILLFGSVLLTSCADSTDIFQTEKGIEIRTSVDQTAAILDQVISEFNTLIRLDHSRLAENEGVFTPPSIVTIFSNAEVNSKLIEINPLAGIDLPYKVLCFSEPDLSTPSVAYTSSEFLMQRHGLSKNDITHYAADLNLVLSSFPKDIISPSNLDQVEKNFGLIIKQSDFDFETTKENLMTGVEAQGDTKIFGEVDYKNEAKTYGIELNKNTLILFGAPEPGGKAMHETPKIGLDAFCQKLLVYEKEGHVFVAYNDIVAFSELYYHKSSIPQKVINYRLNSVFEEAITKE